MRLMGVEHADEFTFKAFRTGKATAMTAEGNCTLGMILAADEWRSAAYLNYVNEERAEELGWKSQAEMDGGTGDCEKKEEVMVPRTPGGMDEQKILRQALEESDEEKDHPEVETKAVRSAFDAVKQEMVPHHLCREFSEGLLEEERQEEMMGTREDHDKLLPYDTGDLEERVARVHINKLLPFTAEDMEESPDFADI